MILQMSETERIEMLKAAVARRIGHPVKIETYEEARSHFLTTHNPDRFTAAEKLLLNETAGFANIGGIGIVWLVNDPKNPPDFARRERWRAAFDLERMGYFDNTTIAKPPREHMPDGGEGFKITADGLRVVAEGHAA